jgi:hypothetical protein
MPSEDGLPPARQWSKKLSVVGGQAVLAVAGHDGLAQEMALSLERSLGEPEQREATESMLRSKLRDALAAPVQRTVALHRTLQGLPGFGVTSNEYVISQSLLAIPFNNSLRLFVLDPECSLTEVTQNLACAAVGSAKQIADPFLAFLRKVLWDEPDHPNIAQAELTAYWTVRHAIENNPAGLSYPIQIVVMTRSGGGSIEIVERGEREMDVMQQVIEEAEEAIKRTFRVHPSGRIEVHRDESPSRKRVPEVRFTMKPPGRGGPGSS